MEGLLANDLDAYSRFALRLILARFPEWEPFGVVRPRPDGVGVTVEFNVPCPSPAAEMGLWVSTADEELSVGFHTHHDHFTDYDARLDPEQVEAGLDNAAAYLEDRCGVVSWYRGGRLAETTKCELPLSVTADWLLERGDRSADDLREKARLAGELGEVPLAASFLATSGGAAAAGVTVTDEEDFLRRHEGEGGPAAHTGDLAAARDEATARGILRRYAAGVFGPLSGTCDLCGAPAENGPPPVLAVASIPLPRECCAACRRMMFADLGGFAALCRARLSPGEGSSHGLAGTTKCQLPSSGPLPRVFANLPVTRGTLRSWSGRFDRDAPIPRA